MGTRALRARARTHAASGRALFSLLTALAFTGCAVIGTGGGGVGALPDPVLSPERPSRAAEARATGLFRQAQQVQAAGDLAAARAAAEEIVERIPGAPVSGRALRLLVDIAYAQESWQEADLHAQRWIRLVPEDDPRVPPLRLLQGAARIRAGDGGGALDRLTALPIGVGSEVADSARALVRAAARESESAAITQRLRALPPGHPFVPPLLAAEARALYNDGERERAQASAEAALAAGAMESDAQVSRVVLEDRVDEALGITGPVTVLGVLLTRTGAPSLTRFAELVEEGVRAAAQALPLTGRLQIVVQDDRGTIEGAAAGMRALEQAGAVAVVGPLEGPGLVAAAMARTRPLPLISPTAPDGGGEQNVYTLGGFDPAPARALARWARGAGIGRVVLIHPRGGESEAAALAFEDAFRASGGLVLARFLYERGTTYFESQMRGVESLRPDAVVLPLPPEDVPTVAPQITFFGLDTLDIRVLGTEGWLRPEVLGAVAPRHTNGVVAVTREGVGDGSGGLATLTAAYESLFRRTLRSPVPAVGFDAASLLLVALRTGARSPTALAGALERVDDFAGATGRLGVEQGWVVREHKVVCIQDNRLLPLGPRERPVLIDRRPPPDATGMRPEFALEGTPVMVLCPGVAAPSGYR